MTPRGVTRSEGAGKSHSDPLVTLGLPPSWVTPGHALPIHHMATPFLNVCSQWHIAFLLASDGRKVGMGPSWAREAPSEVFARNWRKCALIVAPKLVGDKPGAEGGHLCHHPSWRMKPIQSNEAYKTPIPFRKGHWAGGSWDFSVMWTFFCIH